MKEQRTLAEMIADLRQSQQELLDTLAQTSEDALYRRSSEQEWSLAETFAHIAEARKFFTDETIRLLSTPHALMGRTIHDPTRLQNIIDHGNDSRAILHTHLLKSHVELLALLQWMCEEDLQVVGQHVKYGEQTLAEFVQHFLVEHDQTHSQQARKLLTL